MGMLLAMTMAKQAESAKAEEIPFTDESAIIPEETPVQPKKPVRQAKKPVKRTAAKKQTSK